MLHESKLWCCTEREVAIIRITEESCGQSNIGNKIAKEHKGFDGDVELDVI